MTRYYCLARLLEHGPLTKRQAEQITGWSHGSVENALRELRERQVVVSGHAFDRRVPVYRLREEGCA